jgi:hypothetical protein
MYLEDHDGWFMTNSGTGVDDDGAWDYVLAPYDGRGSLSDKSPDLSTDVHQAEQINQIYLCPSDDLESSSPESRLRKTYGPSAYQPETPTNTNNIRMGVVPQRTEHTDYGQLSENIESVTIPRAVLMMGEIRDQDNNINVHTNDTLANFVRVKNAHHMISEDQAQASFIHDLWKINALMMDWSVQYLNTEEALFNDFGNIPGGSAGQNTIYDIRRVP